MALTRRDNIIEKYLMDIAKIKDVPFERYSRKEVQRAGELLLIENIALNDPDKYSHAMQVLSYWRSCHIYPLDIVAEKLQSASKRIDKQSIVAKRLKRTPSIINKLRRFESMKLRNMQDIGGCRAIVSSIKKANKLKRELNKRREFRVVDYIEKPKEDGYRGIHLIGKFIGKNRSDEYSIEIQIRTLVQHAWATAVEIIDLFTNQALKSNQGKQEWKDFFRNVSFEFSKIEGADIQGGNSPYEVHRLAKKLSVRNKFEAYSHSLNILHLNMNIGVEGYYLILIDLKQSTLNAKFFNNDDYSIAINNYLNEEKNSAKNIHTVVALVSTNSIKNLKEAYPNYFADSTVFLELLNRVLSNYEYENPSWIKRLILPLS